MSTNEQWGDIETREGRNFDDIEVPPDGAMPARICALIDVGTHDARTLKGEIYERRCVVLGFELGENDSKGEPFYMARLITLSLDVKSTLFSIVKGVYTEPKIGDKLNPSWLANKPCLLQISHEVKPPKKVGGKERTYANIASVGKPPRGTQTPPGSCVVWRVGGADPLPDLSYLPPMWNEVVGKMLTAAEWAQASKEVHAGAKIVMQTRTPNGQPEPMTQAEANLIANDIPF